MEQRGNLEDNALAQYFATIGMEDADIVYTVMAVKEMIHYGYELNDAQFDDLIANGVILDGELPFCKEQKADVNPSSVKTSNYVPQRHRE